MPARSTALTARAMRTQRTRLSPNICRRMSSVNLQKEKTMLIHSTSSSTKKPKRRNPAFVLGAARLGTFYPPPTPRQYRSRSFPVLATARTILLQTARLTLAYRCTSAIPGDAPESRRRRPNGWRRAQPPLTYRAASLPIDASSPPSHCPHGPVVQILAGCAFRTRIHRASENWLAL